MPYPHNGCQTEQEVKKKILTSCLVKAGQTEEEIIRIPPIFRLFEGCLNEQEVRGNLYRGDPDSNKNTYYIVL